MRQSILFILIFVICACTGRKYPDPIEDKEFDDWSGIEVKQLSDDKLEDLQLLGMVWGFLKYYHPSVAEGRYNWDYELFRVMPAYLATITNSERDLVLLNWLNGLGTIKVRQSNKTVDKRQVKLSPDLDWINHSGLSTELVDKLNEVKNAKRGKVHYYVALMPKVGNPIFKNERDYPTKNADPGFHILALYRYWNIIQYYFPNKHLIGKDWKEVLKESLPEFIAAKGEIEYKLAVLKLIGKIHDGHAQMISQEQKLNHYFGNRYVPVKVSFIDGKPIVTGFVNDSYSQETGLKIGDIIKSIDNKPIEEILVEKMPYTPASNDGAQLRDAARTLLRTTQLSVNVELERDSQSYSRQLKAISLNLFAMNDKYETHFKLITPKIAYINHGTLKCKFLPEMWEKIKSTEGLIIDDRNYPSDFPIYDLSAYLMPQSIPFVKFTNGSIQEPGLFTYTEPLDAGKKNPDCYKGKVIILVNEVTQSSAEFHAMAYRKAPNAIVIGSPTAGADGNISTIVLPGGVKTLISGIGVYYPDGTETQRVGIVPDIVVKPTIVGIKAGKDEVLDKAIALINGNEAIAKDKQR